MTMINKAFAPNPDADERARLRLLSSAFWISQALSTALQCGLLQSLSHGAQTCEDLATSLRLQPRGTRALLWALAAADLVEREGVKWASTSLGQLAASEDGGGYASEAILNRGYWELAGALPELLRSPMEARTNAFFEAQAGDEQGGFAQTMHTQAARHADALTYALELDGKTHLLDVAGGSGVLATSLCERWPSLRATVLDRPEVIARTTIPWIARTSVSKRVTPLAADMFQKFSTGGHDVVLLSRVLHDWGDDDALALLRNVTTGMTSGGTVVVVEEVLEGSPTDRPWSAVLDLCLFALTGAGKSRTLPELDLLLEGVGFQRVDFRHLDCLIDIALYSASPNPR